MKKGMQTIKLWLFNNLFTDIAEEKEAENRKLRAKIGEFTKTIQDLNSKIASVRDRPRPTMADLMREMLAVVRFDLANIEQSGDPTHYLDGMNEESRKAFYASVASVYTNKEFKRMCDWLLNVQANLTVRKGLSDRQNDAGRFTINGIMLIQNELARNNALYEEAVKPPDEFDEYDVVN